LLSLSFGADSRMYFHNLRVNSFGQNPTLFNANSNRLMMNGVTLSGGAKAIDFSQSNIIGLNFVISSSDTTVMIDFTSSNNFIHSMTASNAAGAGVALNNTSNNSTVNTLVVNSNQQGIRFTSATNLTFINTISAHNVSVPLFQSVANATNCRFNGILKALVNACSIFGGTPGFNNTCAKVAPSEISPATDTSSNLISSFVGKVTTDDSKNTQDTNGLSSGSSHINDPLQFENRFRSWGNDGGVFPINTNRGCCISTTCRIWDWSLRNTDSVARNTNSCPSGSISDVHTWSDSTTVTSLRNTQEILFDGVGNDNGICESNENCLYTPNIGAYQGHGNLIKADAGSTTNSNSCADIGSGGTVQNVKLFKYETNGY
jgi:hypothetical protein